MNLISLLQEPGVLGGVLSTLVVLGIVAWGLSKLAKPLRRVSDGLTDLFGEPARPGVDARPGIMERQQNTETHISKILAQNAEILRIQGEHTIALKELFPNHGSSVRDAVNDSLSGVGALSKQVTALDARMEIIEASLSNTTVNVNTTVAHQAPLGETEQE